ncbi:MAG: DUF882 domain-containing protein [Kofleriaceae bacterium]|nr:DUF882 domain-containing protein [Kofleriaceae bacterium]MBP9169244.1 DUF882 domain-containing protein [Kofleriaceae bacterium]MBP9859149.1 DUF882 domain-containing protein [Kofleriaceae bacterium]
MSGLAFLPLVAVGWFAQPAALPGSVVDATTAALERAAEVLAADRVEVTIFDVNHPSSHTFTIGKDGDVDADTMKRLRALFQCKRTHRQHAVDRGLLRMIADVGARWPGQTIEYVSAFRATDARSSRHRQGRAFDFRIRGVTTSEVRDYVWATHREVGVGWYPGSDFVHLDHRPGDKDYAWTDLNGREIRNPYWSVKARRPAEAETTAKPRRGAGS